MSKQAIENTHNEIFGINQLSSFPSELRHSIENFARKHPSQLKEITNYIKTYCAVKTNIKEREWNKLVNQAGKLD